MRRTRGIRATTFMLAGMLILGACRNEAPAKRATKREDVIQDCMRRSVETPTNTALPGGSKPQTRAECEKSNPPDQNDSRPSPGNSPSRSSSPRIARAKQNIAQTARKLTAASADETCAKLDPLIHPYLRPSTPEDLKDQCFNYLSLMKGFQVIASRSHGTGAVIDYSYFVQGNKRAIYSMLLALDKDGSYKVFEVEGAHEAPVALTAPVDAPMAGDVVNAAIGAIRDGNCDKLFALAHETLAPGAGDKVEFCDQYLSSGFQKALQTDPAAAPQLMGGNSLYLFYSLNVKPDRYYTLSVGRVRNAYKFITEIRL